MTCEHKSDVECIMTEHTTIILCITCRKKIYDTAKGLDLIG